METFYDVPDKPINSACSNWAEAKAAYRLFCNPKMTIEKVQEVHRNQIITRAQESGEEYVLAIQDTSKLNFSDHPSMEGMGDIRVGGYARKSKGFFIHPTLLITEKHQFLGVWDFFMWSRATPKAGSEASKWFSGVHATSKFAAQSGKKVVFVGDREADNNQLANEIVKSEMYYVIRSKRIVQNQDRHGGYYYHGLRLDNYGEENFPLLGSYELEVVDRERPEPAKLKFKTRAIKRMAKLNVYVGTIDQKGVPHTVVLVKEESTGNWKGEKVCWILKTNLPAATFSEARRIIDIYVNRWHIENYFKVLKSACALEDCCLRTFDRAKIYAYVMALVGWRLYSIKCAERFMPEESCEIILDELEWKVLLVKSNEDKLNRRYRPVDWSAGPPSVQKAVRMIAILGGHKGRKSDGRPGIMSLARGLIKLENTTDGARLALAGELRHVGKR
jgi:hypothetical protein